MSRVERPHDRRESPTPSRLVVSLFSCVCGERGLVLGGKGSREVPDKSVIYGRRLSLFSFFF